MTVIQAIDWLQSLSCIDGKALDFDQWQKVEAKTNEALEVLNQFRFESTCLLNSIEHNTRY